MGRSEAAHSRRRAQGREISTAVIRTALLDWYRRGHRDLPWRKARDAYAIWVSEIMLQQTRVETVIPYYERFMGAFPTVHALAEAPLDRVLERWSGLGYYRRARLLHAGARAVATNGMPADAEGLRAIPGIGDYTAGAIASIAWGEEAAIVDGNVARVLARLHGVEGDVSRGPENKNIWSLAAELVRGDDPGAFNQALMELGATVCTPRSPKCDACPIARGCVARETGRTESIPAVRKKSAVKQWKRVALVAERDGAILLARRKDHLVFGGLWEPPGVDGSGPRTAALLAKRFGRGAPSRVGNVRHLLSHRDLRVDVWTVECSRADVKSARTARLPPDYDCHEWVRRAKADEKALSSLAKKILAAARHG
jgi:A/G-specific adenine glycosylase